MQPGMVNSLQVVQQLQVATAEAPKEQLAPLLGRMRNSLLKFLTHPDMRVRVSAARCIRNTQERCPEAIVATDMSAARNALAITKKEMADNGEDERHQEFLECLEFILGEPSVLRRNLSPRISAKEVEERGQVVLKASQQSDSQLRAALLDKVIAMDGVVSVTFEAEFVIVATKSASVAADANFLADLLTVVKQQGMQGVSLVSAQAARIGTADCVANVSAGGSSSSSTCIPTEAEREEEQPLPAAMSKVAPWSSWAEFHGVYSQLTSVEPRERAAGVKRVETWTRTRSRLPVAVDVTASFVEIMLNDAYLNSDTCHPRSDHELRLMYAMAVVRLVNGIVDVAQTKRSTILERAHGLEWPQIFVDLRHDASHQNLPPLPVLRLAAQEAVWLLVERFWRPQLHQIEERAGTTSSGRLERTRSAKTLDRRLKALISAVGAAGKPVEEPKKKKKLKRKIDPSTAEMSRFFTSCLMLTDESCSENFALRLVRQVLARAAGLKTPRVDLAPDNCPSLRSISDGFYSSAHEQNEPSAEESERMLLWVGSLMSLPEGKRSRLRQALRGLLPPLRLCALRRIAEEKSSAKGAEIAARGSQLWRALQGMGVDAGANVFESLCQDADSAPTEGLQKMEDLVQKLKSRRFSTGSCEPWTAVGTFLDKEMDIVCREEHSEDVFLPQGAEQTWLKWAADDSGLGSGAVIGFDTEDPAGAEPGEEAEEAEAVLAPESSGQVARLGERPATAKLPPQVPQVWPDPPEEKTLEPISVDQFKELAKELLRQVI
ncbi:unnamed protein product [Effrenium voratum]|nr:unnamed protein product [Effrenium voratum]